MHGPITKAGYIYWEHTFGMSATVVNANATIWMEVYEPFILPTTMGWSYQRNENRSYRMGGDYWNPVLPVVQPGPYRIEVDCEAFGAPETRTFAPGQSMGIHWNPTHIAMAATSAYTVLCEPGRTSQMWIDQG